MPPSEPPRKQNWQRPVSVHSRVMENYFMEARKARSGIGENINLGRALTTLKKPVNEWPRIFEEIGKTKVTKTRN